MINSLPLSSTDQKTFQSDIIEMSATTAISRSACGEEMGEILFWRQRALLQRT